MGRYKTVDDYINSSKEWQSELRRLREILNSTELTEEVKWGGPCYTYDGKNVVGIGAFKSYLGLWFHQGALLRDDKEVLINAQEKLRGQFTYLLIRGQFTYLGKVLLELAEISELSPN